MCMSCACACVHTAQTPQVHIHLYKRSLAALNSESLWSPGPRKNNTLMIVSGPKHIHKRCEAGDRLSWAVTVWGRMPLASFAETQVTDDVKALVTQMVS